MFAQRAIREFRSQTTRWTISIVRQHREMVRAKRTLQCVNQVGILDNWRDPQKTAAQIAKEREQKLGEMVSVE